MTMTYTDEEVRAAEQRITAWVRRHRAFRIAYLQLESAHIEANYAKRPHSLIEDRRTLWAGWAR